MTEEDVAQLANMAGLDLDPAHLPGVMRNLEILEGQTALLFQEPLDPLVEPMAVYRP
jgi:hypothetical protein